MPVVDTAATVADPNEILKTAATIHANKMGDMLVLQTS